jgi:copper homeostasis protein
MPLLEIACFNEGSALNAAKSGADRIELCTNAKAGGTTPLLSTFQRLHYSSDVAIPIYIMIRPHDLNFTYNLSELRQMKDEIEAYRAEGADGFVFGILTEEGKVDEANCKMLLSSAEGRPCTFHRAFDEIAEEHMDEELEVLVRCGFTSVLTSGGKKTAVEGKEVLKRLVERAAGRIEVIVGGGVRSGNLEMLRRETGAGCFHSSAIVNTDGEELASIEEVKQLSDLVK